MWLRLRQIALVANKLEPVIDDLCDVLGIEVCYRDPGVATYGLENALRVGYRGTTNTVVEGFREFGKTVWI